MDPRETKTDPASGRFAQGCALSLSISLRIAISLEWADVASEVGGAGYITETKKLTFVEITSNLSTVQSDSI
jgi:hypothetical protein